MESQTSTSVSSLKAMFEKKGNDAPQIPVRRSTVAAPKGAPLGGASSVQAAAQQQLKHPLSHQFLASSQSLRRNQLHQASSLSQWLRISQSPRKSTLPPLLLSRPRQSKHPQLKASHLHQSQLNRNKRRRYLSYLQTAMMKKMRK
ncbi:hypothetical protein FGO68_gene2136 [Halteria grandinella]|uniref:Uncharacterized protein n=1 Tax=Halteria grandinella TaxID=5974 RepID=A0A8J8T7I5_HALGN|nr:hypothetical protein FGO68_gene2136 [Halteria grandinella]